MFWVQLMAFMVHGIPNVPSPSLFRYPTPNIILYRTLNSEKVYPVLILHTQKVRLAVFVCLCVFFFTTKNRIQRGSLVSRVKSPLRATSYGRGESNVARLNHVLQLIVQIGRSLSIQQPNTQTQ